MAPGLSRRFESLVSYVDRLVVFAGRPYGDLPGWRFLDALLLLGAFLGLLIAIVLLVLGSVDPQGSFLGTLSQAAFAFLLTLLVVGGFFVLSLSGQASQVSESISLDFPFFLDLALLVVQAGGTPQKALETYVDTHPNSDLAKELKVTLQEAEIRSLDAALLAMSDRIRPKSARMILRNLAQSERSTGRVAEFYAEQAIELRSIRAELAERAADRVKVNMTFPVVLITVAIILSMLAGTVIQMQSLF
jgi:pilus assembly protein TadC